VAGLFVSSAGVLAIAVTFGIVTATVGAFGLGGLLLMEARGEGGTSRPVRSFTQQTGQVKPPPGIGGSG
jgi:hypothetical protein